VSAAADVLYRALPAAMQSRVISHYGRRIKRERFNESFVRWQELFRRSERFSAADLRSYQDERLASLVAHAFDHVPYYRRIFDSLGLKPGDVRSVEDLAKLPVLTKGDIRAHFRDLTSTDRRQGRTRLGHTSGTTGAPLEILWDEGVDVLHNAALWRHRGWGGFTFGQPYASLLGRVIVPPENRRPPFYRVNRPWNQYLFSSFHLSAAFLPHYLEALERHDVRFLEAYPSTAYILARYLESAGSVYRMKAVFTSSETLLPMQREVIEERFQCRVFDYYGMAERVMFSGECERHAGHHLFMDYGVTEVVDDAGAPVGPGGLGRLVLTGLHNYRMPLIRYEIGDVSGVRTEPCPCGRTLPLLHAVTTKAEDIVVTPEGRLISSSVLTHPFKPLTTIEKSQLVQEDPAHITVNIVRKPGYTEADTVHLVSAIRSRVGAGVSVRVVYVDDIPRGANGKYRWVISKVPLTLGQSRSENLYE
jgi:phenylacetate-CoA ligase